MFLRVNKRLLLSTFYILLVYSCKNGLEIKNTNHIHVIGIDGALASASQIADTPNINSLIANGDFTWNVYSSEPLSLVFNRDNNLLYGLSWGSRRIYCWTPVGFELYRYNNPSHFVDYQDAKYVGDNLMLASGMNNFDFGVAGQKDIREFGGMALIELPTGRIVNEIPVLIYCGNGCVITHNPMDISVSDQKLQFYFAPEDNKTTIYIYQGEF